MAFNLLGPESLMERYMVLARHMLNAHLAVSVIIDLCAKGPKDLLGA